jgi:hypothetical protein
MPKRSPELEAIAAASSRSSGSKKQRKTGEDLASNVSGDNAEEPPILPPAAVGSHPGTANTEGTRTTPDNVTAPEDWHNLRAEKDGERKTQTKQDTVTDTRTTADNINNSNSNINLTAPEDWNNLSEIQRLLLVDLDGNDAEAVRDALRKLSSLCVNGAGTALTLPEVKHNKQAIHQAGGAGLILQAMRKWWTHAGVQAQGCNALNIASFESTQFQSSALQLGGLETTLLALKNFPTSLQVQLSCCRALPSLCHLLKDHTQRLFHQLDGAHALCSAMKAFPTNPLVQLYGALAFQSACQWEECRQAILDANGFDVLRTAMKNHKDNGTIRKTTAGVMENLCQALQK